MSNKYRLHAYRVLSVLLLCLWSAVASAIVVQINSSTSVVQTTGGLAGTGYGNLSISGTFEVNESGLSSLTFTNFNIVLSPPIASPGVTISDLLFSGASYDGYNFSNSIVCVDVVGVICPEGGITGTYDGSTFTLSGYYFSGNPDEYAYTTTLNAAVIPLPATVWLFSSGLLGLIGVCRRKNNV